MSEYKIEDVTIEHDGKSIHGKTYLPKDAEDGKRVPLVIIANGLGSNMESSGKYAHELAKRGYAAFCFDFCGGHGSSSSGDPLDMTLFSEQMDMETVYDQLSVLPYVDLNNVFLMGMSAGAAVASLVAASKSNLIKGLMLLYPAFSIPTDVRRLYPSRDDLPGSAVLFGDIEVGHGFLETMHDFDFYNVIGLYRGPVLILHGMEDDLVASGFSVRAVNTYANANLDIIAGVGHGFTGGAFKYAVKKIVGFLDEEADLADESGLDGDLNFKGGMGSMFA